MSAAYGGYTTLLVGVGDDNVAPITFNRPEVLNSFNGQMCNEFAEIWDCIRLDDGVHAVVIRAAGERRCVLGSMSKRESRSRRTASPKVIRARI